MKMKMEINRNLVWKYFEKNPLVAHRGLFDPSTERQENSLPAFACAAEQGYGIELDLQQTSDHKLVVFHDEGLLRMCGVDKNVRDCTWEELQTYRLGPSQERIPLFKEVLRVVDGRVPLIVEIKGEGDWLGTTRMAATHLDMYPGPYIVESFHPGVVAWYRLHHPEIIRGQLSSDYFKDGARNNSVAKFVLTHMLTNPFTAPDFVAYNHLYRQTWPLNQLRKKGKVRMVCWTIKSQEQLDDNRSFFEFLIFDSFLPRR